MNNFTDPNKSIFKKYWLLLIIVLIVLVLIFITTTRKSHNDNTSKPDDRMQNGTKNASKMSDGELLSHGVCKGEKKTKLGALPMRESDFSMILPYGLVTGAHVTPIDHQYFSPTDFKSARDTYPVYAMADANLVSAEPRVKPEGVEYRLVFSISCKLFYYYDLVTSLTPEIKSEIEKSKSDPTGLNLAVTEGQLIGHIGGQTLDFAVWDTDVVLSGFVLPENYKSETWKIHTADPLNYYTDALKAQVLKKYIRTAKPISGKIDYDMDGKLIGNWFLEGTNGYAGSDREKYWTGHLSIAPDYLDPESIVISLGNFNGEEAQFGVLNNTPDPATVDSSSGMIKYELVQQDWAESSGKQWDRMTLTTNLKAKNHSTVMGTVLIQMIDQRKIKFEAFPQKTAGDISAFTSLAKIYTR